MERINDDNPGHEAFNPAEIRTCGECRTITGNNKYLYFQVSDGFVMSGDKNIAISFIYLDKGNDNIILQYNGIGNDYKEVIIKKTATGTWKKASVYITDADFSNKQNYYADFRIGNGWDGTMEYISFVEVEKR